MLTKKEANRLRGLILHYVDAAVEEAFAGAQDPEDAEHLREGLANARRSVLNELLVLTGPS